MTFKRLFVVLFTAGLIGSIWMGCEPLAQGQASGQPGATNSSPTTPIGNILDIAENFSVEAQELAKPKRVSAWVDGLIVTQQPGMKDLEIAKMVAGEEADYLYQRTLRKVTRTLRGQNFHERYILIQTKDGLIGWVHEGGVRFIRPAFEHLLDQLLTPIDPNKRTRGPALAPTQDFLIVPGKRVGPIRKSSSEQDLLQIYGSGQVHRGVVALADKTQAPCTVVMPGTNNELKIVWEDAVNMKRVKEIHFLRENSNWYTAEGLSCGLDFSEVVKINKGPINFYGFNWEYSGTVNSWGKGSLSRYNQKFYAAFHPRIPMAQVPAKFVGNQIISSNTTDIDAVHAYIQKLVVYLD